MDAATFDAIVAQVAAGEAVRRTVAQHGVNPREFYAALDADETLAKRYARAKDVAVEAMADEIVSIADDGSNDSYLDEDGNRQNLPDVVQRSRLRVDTRKWLLSKLAPKRYGERLDVNANVTGGLALAINTKPAQSDGQ